MGKRYPLNGDRMVLGRLYESNICLSGQAVSRQHAQLLRRDNKFLIEDLGSSNGTFLNGLRIENSRAVAGDVVTFGSVTFRVKEVHVSTEAAPRLASSSSCSSV